MRRLALAALLAANAGCIVNMGTTTSTTPPEERVPVPDKLQADHPPQLVDSEAEGCKRAPELDPNLYYCEADEHWFRYAMNRWYLAFAWDGNWFPVDKELPQSLRKLTPAPEEVKRSRDERLKELDKKLERIDQGENPEEEQKSREERLKELDEKLKQLDKEQPPEGGH